MDVKLIQVSNRGNREISVDDENFIIGRESDCELQLDQGRISRRHCRILRRGGRVFVQALYSTAGTAVNQQIIEPDGLPVEVHDGDHLWVGSEHFQFAISLAGKASARTAEAQPASPPVDRGESESPTNPLLTTTKKSLARAAHKILEEIISPGEDAEEDDEEPGPQPAPPASRGHLVVTQSKGVSMVELIPKTIVAESDIRTITDELGELIDSGQNCITLNFRNVERLSSQVMGEVVQVYRRCKDSGGTLKICKVPPQVAKILSMTKIDRHIEVFPDERMALESVWPKRVLETSRAPVAEKGPAEWDPGHELIPAPPQRRVRLTLEVGKAKGRVVEVGGPRFLIGRDERCHLRPNSNAISRLHAAIDQREGRVFIHDFGSASGTTLNGRSLHDEEAEAFHGDRLQIDVLLFTISIEDKVGLPRPQALDESLDQLFGGHSTDPHADTMIMKIPDLTAPSAAPAPAPASPTAAGPPASPTPPHTPDRPADSPKKYRKLKHEDVRDVAVVTLLTPDLSDDFDIGSVRIELEALLEQTPHHRMILCLDRVKSMSRGCVVMLLARVQHFSQSRGTIRLCRVSPPVKAFLEKTQLPLLVDIFPTLEDAMDTPWE